MSTINKGLGPMSIASKAKRVGIAKRLKRTAMPMGYQSKPKRRLHNKPFAAYDQAYEDQIGREHELRRKTHTNSPTKPVTLPYISIQHKDIPHD